MHSRRPRSCHIAAAFVVISALLLPAAHAAAQGLSFQQRINNPLAVNDNRFAPVAVDGNVAVIGAFRETIAGRSAQGAAYVFVRNGATWTQQQKLVASDAAAFDQFGTDVAISGNTIVIGAFGKQLVAGPDFNFGAAYVFAFNGTSWVQQARLTASDAAAAAWFGMNVDIDGDTIVVGARQASRPGLSQVGKAYVFERVGVTWTERSLMAGDSVAGDNFGADVSVTGSTVCVGATGALVSGTRRGAAYVFVRGGSAWSLQQKIPAPLTNDGFGRACVVDGDTLAVGAPARAADRGSVETYTRAGATWTAQQTIDGDVAPGGFGAALALRGGALVIGATSDQFLGAVHLYARSGGIWNFQGKELNTSGRTNDLMGAYVALSDTHVFAGAPNVGVSQQPGFVNVYTRAGAGTGVPGAPSGFGATVIGSVVNLVWTAPTSGGAPTGYTLVARTATGQLLTTLPLGNVLGFQVQAPNGVFQVSVVATNASGTGPESVSRTIAVPAAGAVPSAPLNLAVTVSGSTANFTWSPPATGMPSGYLLLAGSTPGFATPIATVPLPAAPTAFAAGGVPSGTYYVRVIAANAAGQGPSSNEVTLMVAGATAPGAPLLAPASVSGGTVSMSWTPGSGGSPQGYLLTASLTAGGAPIASVPVAGTSLLVPGVPAGTYYVRVTALNGAGASVPSNTIAVVVP